MLFWIIRQIIISFIFIFTAHYIYNYFKKNLTVPKIKDLIKKPVKQYEDIYQSQEKDNNVDKETMKNELKDYLKGLSATKNEKKIESIGGGGFSNDSNTNFTTY
tara:strand:- start:8084 stop:8395 length:312 start_codon:yes stop_codon:yes gene_type:complete